MILHIDIASLGKQLLQSFIVGFLLSLCTLLPEPFSGPFQRAFGEHLTPYSLLLLFASLNIFWALWFALRPSFTLPQTIYAALVAATTFVLIYVAAYAGIQLGAACTAQPGYSFRAFVTFLGLAVAGGFIFCYTLYNRLDPQKDRAWLYTFAGGLLLHGVFYYFLAVQRYLRETPNTQQATQHVLESHDVS
jgi:hypothetical protein